MAIVKEVNDDGRVLAGPVGMVAAALSAAQALEDLAFGLLATCECNDV